MIFPLRPSTELPLPRFTGVGAAFASIVPYTPRTDIVCPGGRFFFVTSAF